MYIGESKKQTSRPKKSAGGGRIAAADALRAARHKKNGGETNTAKTIYCAAEHAQENVSILRREQARKNCFVNIAVKPYHGKKYPAGTVRIVVG